MSTATNLSILYQDVSVLLPYARNARTHSKKQIRQIADSIQTFGFTNPILIDHANTIIAGHGRIDAAKLLGIKMVPTIRLEHLTEEQKRAYILADNRLAEEAGWDKSILAIEFQHLLTIETDFNLSITGFEIPEIDLIIQEATHKPAEVEDFEVDKSVPLISKLGDLWRLDNHLLLCGDALEGIRVCTH